jgi:hypothetical protein
MSKDEKIDHHLDEKIVVLTRVPSRGEADLMIAKLKANGIDAIGSYGDSDGWAPQYGLVQGYGVLVFENDLVRARALIEEER